MSDSPTVNLINDPIPPSRTMNVFEVFANPLNEVVLEDALN